MPRCLLLLSFIAEFLFFYTNTQAQIISAGTPSGTISTCVGMASENPNLQQFTVTGSSLIADISATAPANFEISLTANGSYSGSIILTHANGSVSAIVYVRSAASAAVGNIAGNVVLTSINAPTQNVAVKGSVNALPTVNMVANQTVDNGLTTIAINFTGTGMAFGWTNNTPGIGLPASGTGDIPSFTAINTSNTPVTATFTATPIPAGFVYVVNSDDNTVSVINSGNNKVVATIPVGDLPESAVVSPDGKKVYVPNDLGNSVSVIDAITNQVIITILVGKGPQFITMSPDGSRIYTSNVSSNDISVINALNNNVVATIPVGSVPVESVISPDGSHLYVVNVYSNFMSVINTVTNIVEAKINGITRPSDVLINQSGSRLYVTQSNPSAIVTVINTATNSKITDIPVDIKPNSLSISPDGKWLYTVNNPSNNVSVINTTTNKVVATIPVGYYAIETAITPDGSRLYVLSSGAKTVTVISTATNSVITTIPLNYAPHGLSMSPDGSRIYVHNPIGKKVTVINTATNSVITNIPVGANPSVFAKGISKGNGCSGTPITFTITVNQTIPTINISGTPGALSTTYGTASASSSFIVSGKDLSAGILVTPPAGFEVSTDNNTFSSVLTIAGTGTVASTTVYIRLAAVTNAGNYSGNIILNSTGAANVNVPMPQSTVSPAPITFIGSYGKIYGDALSDYRIFYNTPGTVFDINKDLKNGNTFNSIQLTFSAGAVNTAPVGAYKNSVTPSAFKGDNGFLSSNYDIAYPPFDLVVLPAPLIITANNVDKQYGTVLADVTASNGFTVTGIKNNETIGAVSIAYGDGAAATDPVGVHDGSVVASAAIGGTFTAGNYSITYVPANININAIPVPAIATIGTPSAVNTTYGTASPSTSFNISGTNLSGGILVTPPAGFEVSTDNITFSSSVFLGNSGLIANVPVYIRLSSTTNAGTYNGNIGLSSTGAGPVEIAMPNSVVSPVLLTIAGLNINKPYGAILTTVTGLDFYKISAGELKNGNTIDAVKIVYGAGYNAVAAVGTYVGSVVPAVVSGGNGFLASNYTITYIQGNIIVDAATLKITADNKIKAFGTINPILTCTYSGFVNNETQTQLTSLPEITTTATTASAEGLYPIDLTGGAAANYTFVYVPGVLTITQAPPAVLVFPNTFTPNGDGINDTWNLTDLATFPSCSVNIFNRYGQRVFTSVGYGIPWDGTYKGANVPTGAYYYVIDLKNKSKVLSGSVTVIR